jgi:glycosyltransferase involved in cell wall biosynthesis
LASIDKNNWVNRSYQEFLKYHQEKPFDAVISQSSAGLGIIKRKRELGIKIVGISHGTIGGEMKTLLNSAKGAGDVIKSAKSLAFGTVNYFGRQREYIHGCDRVVAVSSVVKESIINETFASAEKIIVIHNGIDGSKIPKKNWGDTEVGEPFKILYIGRIEESKGLRELLIACRDVGGVFVNIVGDGPFLEELKDLSRQYKMSQKVLFYGKLPYEKVVETYTCNDVFVLPTKRVEGLPMTLVEACFAGLPIIATNMGGNKDVVDNQLNGFLLDKLNTDVLKAKIVELSKNQNLAKNMGLNGKIKAEKEFTLDRMIDSYEGVLRSL